MTWPATAPCFFLPALQNLHFLPPNQLLGLQDDPDSTLPINNNSIWNCLTLWLPLYHFALSLWERKGSTICFRNYDVFHNSQLTDKLQKQITNSIRIRFLVPQEQSFKIASLNMSFQNLTFDVVAQITAQRGSDHCSPFHHVKEKIKLVQYDFCCFTPLDKY